MNTCPCCSNQLLRHIRHQEIYWFCTSCRQEMPNLDPLFKSNEDWLYAQFKQRKQFFSRSCLERRLVSSTPKTVLKDSL